jgi:hypothetical protein
MSAMKKGLLLGIIQVAMILGVSGKLLDDRWTRPRAWALGVVYDPELPIRGKYLSQRLQYPAEGFTYQAPANKNASDWFENRRWAYLESREGSWWGKWCGLGRGNGCICTRIMMEALWRSAMNRC